MKNILPSKSFVKVFGSIVLILALIFLIGVIFNRKTVFQKGEDKKNTEVIVVKELVEKDTDGDGLKDWEESIWGTDENKVDTDENGKNDFEEVREKQKVLTDGYETEEGEDSTKTALFSREMLTIVSSLSQGGQLNQENQEAISEQIADYLSKNSEKIYTITDLEITTMSKKDTDKYLLKINEIMKNSAPTEQEIVSAVEYEKTIDEENLDILIKASKKFESQENILKTLVVPETFQLEHLAFLNALSNLKTLYKKLSLYETDPLMALSGYQGIEDVILGYRNALNGFSIKIKSL